ncbi:sigma-70 family RNA polymerase sigma factor [Candidatus Poriferisodalis sp.]|uniref:RNA polymerase sigma factor n=1 Tax=Candidatus Poriferisodalis sp. TaxID=3101277 RepID=UPI003B51DC78
MALRLEDRDLVLAYQAGDDEAFAELVREYRPQLLNHARRRLSCNESAEDAVQETLVRALRAMPRFNGNYLVGPWLHRILANVCIDEGNRRRREGEKTERAAVNDTALQPTPSVETELGLDLDLSELADAVEGLSEPYREALHMRFVEELSYDEMAEAAGVSEDNARARVSRARTALRSAMRVAAFVPVTLVGLLRRGERAASAVAGHGATAGSTAAQSSMASAMPLLTETAPVASRAASAVANVATTGVPVVAKAAVSLGLATAVITPTVDSPVHKAAERVLPDSVIEVLTPLAVEVPAPDAPVVVPAAEVPAAVEAVPTVVEAEAASAVAEAEVTPAAATVSQEETVASADEQPAAATADVEQQDAPVATGTDNDTSSAAAAAVSAVPDTDGAREVVDQTVGGTDTQNVADTTAVDESEASAVSEPVVTVVATSSVEGADLTFTPSGANRYDVAGTLSLTVTTTTTTTTDEVESVEATTMSKSVAVVVPSTASLQAVDPAVDERRFSALLVFAPGDDGASAEMRLAARGTENDDGSLSMSGVFTGTPTESLPLVDRGALSGTLMLDADGLPQSLAVTLTQ